MGIPGNWRFGDLELSRAGISCACCERHGRTGRTPQEAPQAVCTGRHGSRRQTAKRRFLSLPWTPTRPVSERSSCELSGGYRCRRGLARDSTQRGTGANGVPVRIRPLLPPSLPGGGLAWRAPWRAQPSRGMVEPNNTCFPNRVRKFDSCRGHWVQVPHGSGCFRWSRTRPPSGDHAASARAAASAHRGSRRGWP